MSDSLPLFIKDMRKKFGLTQVDLAAKSGVGLRFAVSYTHMTLPTKLEL